jgi:hypothetical protein
VHSRLGLVALWALFAAASVGVGFGAAGLVGDPFTDPGGAQVTVADAGDPGAAGDTSGPSSPPSSSASPSDSSTTPAPSRTRSATPSATGTTAAAAPVVRSLTTRGGLVSGSCTRGLVTVSAAPTVGWAIKDVDGGPAREARVRFEPTGDGDGRVEVRARCVGGVPHFSVEDRTDNSGPGGGGDSGGGSGRGGGGSGGSGGSGPG